MAAAAAAVFGHEALVERREAVDDGLECVFGGQDGRADMARRFHAVAGG